MVQTFRGPRTPRPDPRRIHPEDGGPLAGVHGLCGGPSQTGWRGTGGDLGAAPWWPWAPGQIKRVRSCVRVAGHVRRSEFSSVTSSTFRDDGCDSEIGYEIRRFCPRKKVITTEGLFYKHRGRNFLRISFKTDCWKPFLYFIFQFDLKCLMLFLFVYHKNLFRWFAKLLKMK